MVWCDWFSPQGYVAGNLALKFGIWPHINKLIVEIKPCFRTFHSRYLFIISYHTLRYGGVF